MECESLKHKCLYFQRNYRDTQHRLTTIGATSICERWDAVKEDGTVKDGKDADINI